MNTSKNSHIRTHTRPRRTNYYRDKYNKNLNVKKIIYNLKGIKSDPIQNPVKDFIDNFESGNLRKCNDIIRILDNSTKDIVLSHYLKSVNRNTSVFNLILSDPNYKLTMGKNIYMKISKENIEYFKIFVKHPQFNPNGRDGEIIKLLIKEPESIKAILSNFNFRIEDSERLIISKCNDSEVIQNLFIHPGFNPNLIKQDIFRLSRKFKTLDLMKLMVENPRFNPSEMYKSIIKWCEYRKRFDILVSLLKKPEIDYIRFICSIVKYTDKKFYFNFMKENTILDARFDNSIKDNYLIIWGASRGYTSLVNVLLKDPRVNPAAQLNSAIIEAAKNGHIGVISTLLKDFRVDPTVYNWYPIKVAYINRHKILLKTLMNDPRVDINDTTPLILDEYNAVTLKMISMELQ